MCQPVSKVYNTRRILASVKMTPIPVSPCQASKLAIGAVLTFAGYRLVKHYLRKSETQEENEDTESYSSAITDEHQSGTTAPDELYEKESSALSEGTTVPATIASGSPGRSEDTERRLSHAAEAQLAVFQQARKKLQQKKIRRIY